MAAWAAFARKHAPDTPASYFHRTFGLRNDAIIGGLIDGLNPDRLRELAAEKERLFRESARGHLVLLPGVRELLESLAANGVPAAVVTSTPRENLAMILETLHIERYFGALVAEEDTTKGKPDPEGFLLAASRLGVPPERCVVIEDAPAGLDAARAAGMKAIGVTTTRPAPDLAAADLVVESLAEESVATFIYSLLRAGG